MEVIINTEDSCRTCLQGECTLVNIFEDYEGRPISQILSELCGLNIEADDQLSKKICKNCVSKTLMFLSFRQVCIDSDETVRYNLLIAEADGSEMMSVVNLKVGDDISGNIDEYLIADEASASQTNYELQRSDETEYEEIFLDDDSEEIAEDAHQTIPEAESLDECLDVKDEKPEPKMIEAVVTKINSQEPIVITRSCDELTQKMREVHFAKEQQKKHKCPHCDKYFMFPSKVNRHVQAVHKTLEDKPRKDIRKNHFCNICGKAFVSAFKVRRHMVVHDTELKIGLQKNWSRNYFLCEACNKKFHTQTTFDRHKLICKLLQESFIERNEGHEYLCCICSQNFPTHDEMVDHMRTHSSLEPVSCILCSNFGSYLNDMIRHGKYHDENVTYRCCVCNKNYPNGEEIVSHLLRHKDYKPFTCSECSRSFFDKYKLRQHMNTHIADAPKNFICRHCNRGFTAQDYLNCHIRRKHSDVKPYRCDFCPKTFAFAHDRNLHVTNHSEKKYLCSICDASFTRSWSLKQHMTIHDPSTEGLKCEFCDFMSTTKYRLQLHLMTHEEQNQLQDNTIEEENYTFLEDVNEDSNETYNLVEIQTSY
ncbi:CLUMA_CG010003, isoform A [Clunio marinus]|uniref:CLUMA_CG010003, isoform A n=1 Tax=Clunio marinus TaxID=568069 RepID=A0A1J1IAQ3_9DIPT|nr:CLUMA_CG010003, isoform A [Clunio marinus]